MPSVTRRGRNTEKQKHINRTKTRSSLIVLKQTAHETGIIGNTRHMLRIFINLIQGVEVMHIWFLSDMRAIVCLLHILDICHKIFSSRALIFIHLFIYLTLLFPISFRTSVITRKQRQTASKLFFFFFFLSWKQEVWGGKKKKNEKLYHLHVPQLLIWFNLENISGKFSLKWQR